MAKRILIFTNHFFPENFKVNELAQLFNDEGHIVHVVTGLPNYPTGKVFEGYGLFKRAFEQKNSNFSVIRLPLIPRGNGSRIRLISNYLSYFLSTSIYTIYLAIFRRKYDVVFVHHTSPIFITIPPIFYRWLRGSKNILWDLDMWPDTLVALNVLKSKSAEALLEKVMTKVYHSYDHILLGSKSFLDKAIQRVGDIKPAYFPNWAEQIFSSEEYTKPKIEPKFPNGFKIMYAGNIGQAQDFENVFKAMKMLKDEPVSWLFVGDGRQREWLEKNVNDEGLLSKVTFYGNQPLDLMPYFFSNADVMFLSLKDEVIFHKTVPAKLQAYMAFGKPVLAMISGEGAQIIKEAKGGFVAESGDYEALVNLVRCYIVLDSKSMEEMSSNNRMFYSDHFSMSSRKKQLMELIS